MNIDLSVFTLDTLNEDYFNEHGYIVVKILEDEEVSKMQRIGKKLIKEAYENALLDKSGNLRDNLFSDMFRYKDLHHLTFNPAILKVIKKILGGNIILEGAVILLAIKANEYIQGWHRDVWQIPEELIDDRLFSPNRTHNCIQVNMAFLQDSSFWVVPGSHKRADLFSEKQLFAGSKHKTSEDVVMPNSQCLHIHPGQAIFYNNNIIHRGHNALKVQRATFHASYHSDLLPPTWHFYNPGFRTLTYSQINHLAPELIEMWNRSQSRYMQYPDIKTSWSCV